MIETVNGLAPNFKAAVLGRQIMSPLDLERTFGLIGGDIFHGQLSLDQMFSARPMLGHGTIGGPCPDCTCAARARIPAAASPGRRDTTPRARSSRTSLARSYVARAQPTMTATKPRFERQEADVRRKALVAATIESLKRYGHEGLSVRRISAEAGVSIGLINHHFPNKNALVAEAYRHFNSQLIEGIRSAVGRASDAPRERLHALFKATFSPPNLDRDVLAVWIVLWGLYHHSAEIQAVHDEAYGGYMALLREELGALQKEYGRMKMSLTGGHRLAGVTGWALARVVPRSG